MKLLRGLYNLPADWLGCVATIGNFDGIHRGHQVLLETTIARARTQGVPSVVILFEPQPGEFFATKDSEASTVGVRLMRLREKYHAIANYPIDYVLCLRFDHALAHLSAQDFISHLLINTLKIKGMIIGDDFRFGAGRGGDTKSLQQASNTHQFSLDIIPALTDQNQRISSTRIRQCLIDENFTQATQLLGHPYYLIGRVIHGQHLGRELNCPTANITIPGITEAINGVHVVQVTTLSTQQYYQAPGVASIGYRPAVNGTHRLLEVHLLDVPKNLDLYGQRLQVELLYKLRNEENFDSLETLKEQIYHDIQSARSFFARL